MSEPRPPSQNPGHDGMHVGDHYAAPRCDNTRQFLYRRAQRGQVRERERAHGRSDRGGFYGQRAEISVQELCVGNLFSGSVQHLGRAVDSDHTVARNEQGGQTSSAASRIQDRTLGEVFEDLFERRLLGADQGVVAVVVGVGPHVVAGLDVGGGQIAGSRQLRFVEAAREVDHLFDPGRHRAYVAGGSHPEQSETLKPEHVLAESKLTPILIHPYQDKSVGRGGAARYSNARNALNTDLVLAGARSAIGYLSRPARTSEPEWPPEGHTILQMTERLVVIGGDAAGMSAASQARRLRGPQELSIVAFDRGNYLSYSACGIPYFVGGAVQEIDKLIVRTPEEFASKQDIDARIRHEVTEIDLDKGAVKVTSSDDGAEAWEGFDKLLVATGATPRRPSLPHADADGIFGVQILDDGRAIFEAMRERRPQRAAVVGGGYIGLEMAEAFKMRGLDVAVVEASSHPMPSLDDDIAALIADAMESMGIAFHSSERVEAFEAKDGWVSAVVTSKRTIPADIVVLGLGVAPNVELAEAAGIPIGPSGAISVDRRMQTGVEAVWAAGDCSEKFHRVSRRSVSMALGTHANKEGRVAGINLGGGYATFPGVIGTAVSKLCDTEVGRTGLNEDEAGGAGFTFITATVDSTTRAGYYPESQPIKTKLLAERGSGRLLGAQIVGKEGAAKRIDVLATAIWNEMSVAELLNIDLSYAPPFSPVWDPVLIAARKAWQLVEQSAKKP